MTLWKRAMDYLGLGPEDPYDDYDVVEEPEPSRPVRQSRPAATQWDQEPQRPVRGRNSGWDDEPSVRPMPTRVTPSDLDPVPPRRQGPVESSDPSGLTVRQPHRSAGSANVRVQPSAPGEPHTVKPRRFDQAQEVADKFKEGQPVIMNLEGTERDVSRRLIDFASGLCYALNGSMEKVATGVYLLKPMSRSAYGDGYSD
jgi:cell division inhibitor SepF